MSGVFGSGTKVTNYSGIDIQSTSASLPIPIIYGQAMLTPNLVDYDGFKKVKKGAKGNFGKGGILSSGEEIYTADVIMAIGEGPISSIVGIYQTSYTLLSSTQCGLSLIGGSIGQSPTSYWSSTYPTKALGYTGIAYAYGIGFDLGPSASVGSNSMVIDGILSGSGFNGVDADPSEVIADFLTNQHYGVGFPSASIDSATLAGTGSGDASLKTYVWAQGFAFSPVLNSKEPANTTLTRWLQLLNCTAVWSSGQLKFIPYGDTMITGNGYTYVPNLTPLYNLTDEHFVDSGDDDPIIVMRSDPYSRPNRLSLEIVGRSDNFQTGPVTVWDQAAIDRFGLREGSTITAHEFLDPGIAQLSAQLILQRGIYVARTFQFKLSWEFGLLDPMDIIEINDPLVGLVNQLVRITDIEEADDGMLTVTAEEFVVGVGTPQAYAIQANSNGIPDGNVAPNSVNTPIIFELPAQVSGNQVTIVAGVSPQSADANWGGAYVWASYDGTTYSQVATITGPSTMGSTTASLASYSGSNPDTSDTLSVSLAESGQPLSSTTMANAAAGTTVCYVGGEFISFETATLTGANAYNLTSLWRGLYGVGSISIASGSQFLYLGGSLARYNVPPANIGDTLYLKFQSFNIFGAAVEDLSVCTAYTYTITGAGVVPSLLNIDYGNNQSTPHSTAFSGALGVIVTNSTGTPLAGYNVTFTAPASGASCLFSGSHTTSVVTNSSGLAAAPAPTANSSTGTYSVIATVGGTAVPTTFTLTNT